MHHLLCLHHLVESLLLLLFLEILAHKIPQHFLLYLSGFLQFFQQLLQLPLPLSQYFLLFLLKHFVVLQNLLLYFLFLQSLFLVDIVVVLHLCLLLALFQFLIHSLLSRLLRQHLHLDCQFLFQPRILSFLFCSLLVRRCLFQCCFFYKL